MQQQHHHYHQHQQRPSRHSHSSPSSASHLASSSWHHHAGHLARRGCQLMLALSLAGWFAGHCYSFLGTWSRYRLQYDRKYLPYIEANCGDSRFHEVTLGLNHCDAFMEQVSIPAWERALFEEVQRLPVCASGRCDAVVADVTNNKGWLCFYLALFACCAVAMLRVKWYLEKQIRSNLPLDNPTAYIETVSAPSYVDRDGASWTYQLGLRRRINHHDKKHDNDDNGVAIVRGGGGFDADDISL